MRKYKSINDIADEMGVSRNHLYLKVKRLVEKGILSNDSIKKERGTHREIMLFTAEQAELIKEAEKNAKIRDFNKEHFNELEEIDKLTKQQQKMYHNRLELLTKRRIKCLKCKHYYVKVEGKRTFHACKLHPNILVVGQLQDKIQPYCTSFSEKGEVNA